MRTPEDHFLSLRQALGTIKSTKTRDAYLEFHDKHRQLFLTMPASVQQHHCWPGGYAAHLDEVVTNAILLAKTMPLPTPAGFTEDDVVTAAYVHDLDKLLYRYELDGEPPTGPQADFARRLGIVISDNETKASISVKIDAAKSGKPLNADRIPRHKYREDALDFEDGAIVMKLCMDHGLSLSEMALHAVCVHHGGFSALAKSKGRLKMEGLGVLIHTADMFSASYQRGEPLSKDTLGMSSTGRGVGFPVVPAAVSVPPPLPAIA